MLCRSEAEGKNCRPVISECEKKDKQLSTGGAVTCDWHGETRGRGWYGEVGGSEAKMAEVRSGFQKLVEKWAHPTRKRGPGNMHAARQINSARKLRSPQPTTTPKRRRCDPLCFNLYCSQTRTEIERDSEFAPYICCDTSPQCGGVMLQHDKKFSKHQLGEANFFAFRVLADVKRYKLVADRKREINFPEQAHVNYVCGRAVGVSVMKMEAQEILNFPLQIANNWEYCTGRKEKGGQDGSLYLRATDALKTILVLSVHVMKALGSTLLQESSRKFNCILKHNLFGSTEHPNMLSKTIPHSEMVWKDFICKSGGNFVLVFEIRMGRTNDWLPTAGVSSHCPPSCFCFSESFFRKPSSEPTHGCFSPAPTPCPLDSHLSFPCLFVHLPPIFLPSFTQFSK
ncbi:Phosphatidylglycerol--prolipoprotein diacylglyceryl transferase [Dirofilaria immitis]